MTARKYALYEMGELEDAVCRSAHSAELAAHALEAIVCRDTLHVPLTKDEQEVLYFAVDEALAYAVTAKVRFYELG